MTDRDTWHGPGCDCSWCVRPVGATDSPDETPLHNPWDATCIRNGFGEPSREGERCYICHPDTPTTPPQPTDSAACLLKIGLNCPCADCQQAREITEALPPIEGDPFYLLLKENDQLAGAVAEIRALHADVVQAIRQADAKREEGICHGGRRCQAERYWSGVIDANRLNLRRLDQILAALDKADARE